MNEHEQLIKKVNYILNETKAIEDKSKRDEFFESNLGVLRSFQDDLQTIVRVYQFKDYSDKNQMEFCNSLKESLVKLLSIDGFFEKFEGFEYFKANVLDALEYNENRYAFNLQFEQTTEKVMSALEYFRDRDEYTKAVKENNFLEGQGLNESSAKKFCKNTYAKNMIGHALIFFKQNFNILKREDVIKVLGILDNSDFFEEVASKDTKKMDFFEQNLMYQYTDSILKMKSIFTPNIVKNDKMLRKMWEGQINDTKTIKNIFENISSDCIMQMLESDKSEKGTIIKLADHFKSLNLSDENVSLIVSTFLGKGDFSYEIADFLAEIDIPKDYKAFLESEHSDKYSWLKVGSAFEVLKNKDKSLEEARAPFLPAKYYIKKIENSKQYPNLDYDFLQNLFKLLYTDYFSQDEKNKIMQTLEKTSYKSSLMKDEVITFEEGEKPSVVYKKAIQSYFSGQVIPFDIAKQIISKSFKGKIFDKEVLNKKLLEVSVQSVTATILKQQGIDIGNKVFFGDGHNQNLGYMNPEHKAIWYDKNLIKNFLKSKDLEDRLQLFETIFHECHHARQYDDMTKGKVDFKVYNFIKEEIIMQYDENFYQENYGKIFLESDARKDSIIGEISFLNDIDLEIGKTLKEKLALKYIKETEKYNISNDQNKKLDIGTKGTRIEISDYVGKLIENNPGILIENPILNIEYNADGSCKDIETLLTEFKNQEFKNKKHYHDVYSIYYGVISKRIETQELTSEETEKAVCDFIKMSKELVNAEKMQDYYHEVDNSNFKATYSRLTSAIRGKGLGTYISEKKGEQDVNSGR